MKFPGDDEDVAGPLPTNTPRTRRQFIDQINRRQATVLDEGGSAQDVPVSSLPPGAREGQYVRGGRPGAAPPDEGAAIRASLAAGDKGGPIVLDPNNPSPAPRAQWHFVDQINRHVATVLDQDGHAQDVPVSRLPKGVKEGHYISGGKIIPPPPDEGAAIRADLSKGDAGGTINLGDQPAAAGQPPPGAQGAAAGASPAIPGARFTGYHKVFGELTFDSNELEKRAQDARTRHMKDLEPLIKIKGLEEYAPALTAAAGVPGTSTEDMFRLVKQCIDDKRKRDEAEQYKMTAGQQFSVKDKLANAAMLKAKKYQPGGGSAATGGGGMEAAARVLQEGGTQLEAIRAGGLSDPKDIRALGTLETQVEKVKSREVRDDENHDLGLANRGVDAAALSKQINGAHQAIRALQSYRANLAAAGNAVNVPFGQSPLNPATSDEQKQALRKADFDYQAAVSAIRVAEMQPQAAFALKMDQEGVGHAGTGPAARLGGKFLTDEEAAHAIARIQQTVEASLARSTRREAPVGHSQPEPAANPLTRAAKAKKGGAKRSLDDIAAEHGL